MNNKISIQSWCKENGIYFEKNFEVKNKSWLKAGGTIRSFIMPKNKDEIKKLIINLKINKTKFYIIGNFSNIILRDGIINTPIINLNHMNKFDHELKDGDLNLNVQSGVSIPKFSKYISNMGFKGAEGLLGIPGSIGGGIYMNSSSYGSYLSEYLIQVEALDYEGNEKILKKEDIKFSWRKSIFHDQDMIILNCKFLFPKQNNIGHELTKKKLNSILLHRSRFQEKKLPNLGSIFATKNIYEDLAKVSFIYFILFFINKLLSFIFFKFLKKYIFDYRRIMINIYSKILGLDKFKSFSVSSKTLNCLVNNGTTKADEAIKLLKHFKKKVDNKVFLENIIVENIE